jgi:hypothetical protein
MKNYIKILGDKIFLKYTEVVSWFNTPFETTKGAEMILYLAIIFAMVQLATLNYIQGCF